MKVSISAGHYPERPGACYGDFCEHGEAVQWSSLITTYLLTSGIEVQRVNSGPLKSKVAEINEFNPDFAIEIHFNSEPRRIARGVEVLYYPGSKQGAYIADVILDSLTPLFYPNRGIKEGWYQMNRSKGPDFFLAKTRCPSAIIEPEFIHNKEVITEHREAACKAIANSIITIEL